MIPNLHNFYQKIKAKDTLPTSFSEDSITVIPKPDKSISRKDSYIPESPMNIDSKS